MSKGYLKLLKECQDVFAVAFFLPVGYKQDEIDHRKLDKMGNEAL